MQNLTMGRMLPQAKDLEEYVLGCMMMDRVAVDTVSLILHPECFYLDAHQRICKTIFMLDRKGQVPDEITVFQALHTSGELEQCGGAYYLTVLTGKVTSSANLEIWAKIISQKWMLREMIMQGSKLVMDAYEPTSDAFELLEEAEKKILGIADKHLKSELQSMDSACMDTIEQLNIWRNKNSELTGVPTGFDRLNAYTRGWQNGELIIIAARPSVGKTSFALHAARAAAKAFNREAEISGNPRKTVAIWSLEMKTMYLLLRMLAAESQTVLNRLLKGSLDDDNMRLLHADGFSKLSEMGIFFDDSSGLTPYILRAKARRMKKKHNLGLIIVDYLQLMHEPESKGNREQEISKISRALKILAKELDVPIIALSQMSREIEKRTGKRRIPMLSDLRESGAIEQDADGVFFLWAPEEEEIEKDGDLANKRFGRLAKYRNGDLGNVNFEFEKDFQTWKEFKDDLTGNWRPVAEINNRIEGKTK